MALGAGRELRNLLIRKIDFMLKVQVVPTKAAGCLVLEEEIFLSVLIVC